MAKIDINKKYRYRNGDPATILTTQRPIQKWRVISMDDSGTLRFHDMYGAERTSFHNDLVEPTEWDHIERGDVVEVRNNGESIWKLRRFEAINNGKPFAFHDNGNVAGSWDECRLVCAKNNEEWKLAARK